MSEIKIFVKNFEIIKDTKLILNGIVGVVGESNNGKSAIYNAIKTLTYNIQGSNYIRIEKGKKAGAASVGIMFEDGSSVKFEKLNSAGYILGVDGTQSVYEKVGRSGAPEDIIKVLNMEPLDIDNNKFYLNFLDQFQTPLISQMSEYQLYKTAVKSYDGEKIQEAITNCRIDHDNVLSMFRDKEIIIELKKKERIKVLNKLKVYEDNDILIVAEQSKIFNSNVLYRPVYENFNFRYVALDISMGRVKDIQNKFNGLNGLEKTSSVVAVKLNNRMAYLAYFNRFEQLNKQIEGVTVLKNKINIDDVIINDIVKAREYANVFDLCIDFNNRAHTLDDEKEFVKRELESYKGFKSVRKDYDTYVINEGKRFSYQTYIDQLDLFTKNLALVKDQKKQVDEELAINKKIIDEGLCPLCKIKTGNHKHNKEMDAEVKKVLDRVDILSQKQAGFKSQEEILDKQVKDLGAECLQKTGSQITEMAKKIKEIDEFNEKFVADTLPRLDKIEGDLAVVQNVEFQGDPNAGQQFVNPPNQDSGNFQQA